MLPGIAVAAFCSDVLLVYCKAPTDNTVKCVKFRVYEDTYSGLVCLEFAGRT